MLESSAEQVPARRALRRGLASPGCALELGAVMISDRHRAKLASEESSAAKRQMEMPHCRLINRVVERFWIWGSWFLSTPLPHTPLSQWAAATSGSLCSAHGRAHLWEAALLHSPTSWG